MRVIVSLVINTCGTMIAPSIYDPWYWFWISLGFPGSDSIHSVPDPCCNVRERERERREGGVGRKRKGEGREIETEVGRDRNRYEQ